MNQMNYPHDIDVILRRNVDILQQWIEQKKGHLRQILLKYGKNVIKRLEIIKQNRCNTWSNALYC